MPLAFLLLALIVCIDLTPDEVIGTEILPSVYAELTPVSAFGMPPVSIELAPSMLA